MRLVLTPLGVRKGVFGTTLYRPGNKWINDSSAYGHFGKDAWLMTPKYGVLL